jgi:cytochrome c-type biogenesis protein CcmH
MLRAIILGPIFNSKIGFYLIYIFSLLSLILFLSINTAFSQSNDFKHQSLSINQEKRAHNLFLQVKCLICEGQVIESSDTQIAIELRKLIKAKIYQGYNDDEIKDYLVQNYGADILTSPPINSQTIFLWLLPLVFLSIGILLIVNRITKRGS